MDFDCLDDGAAEGNSPIDSYEVSNEKNPGCLGYIGDYTTQLYGDYSKPF